MATTNSIPYQRRRSSSVAGRGVPDGILMVMRLRGPAYLDFRWGDRWGRLVPGKSCSRVGPTFPTPVKGVTVFRRARGLSPICRRSVASTRPREYRAGHWPSVRGPRSRREGGFGCLGLFGVSLVDLEGLFHDPSGDVHEGD